MRLRTALATGGLALGVAATTLLTAGPAAAGVTGPALYVEGQLYRTVGTPTDLSGTGAPAQAWDFIYDLGGHQPNVATAAPGDPGFNGGRWQVHGLAIPDYQAAVDAGDANGNGVLDSAAEVHRAIDAGAVTDLGVVRQFECPVIPVPRSGP